MAAREVLTALVVAVTALAVLQQGGIAAQAKARGELLWNITIPSAMGQCFNGRPALNETSNTLYINPTSFKPRHLSYFLRALDATTGAVRYSMPVSVAAHDLQLWVLKGEPCVCYVGTLSYVSDGPFPFVCRRQRDGAEFWRPTPTTGAVWAFDFDETKEHLYILAHGGKLWVASAGDGSLRVLATGLPGPQLLVAKPPGHLTVLDADANLVRMSRATGKATWTTPLEYRNYSTSSAPGSTMFVHPTTHWTYTIAKFVDNDYPLFAVNKTGGLEKAAPNDAVAWPRSWAVMDSSTLWVGADGLVAINAQTLQPSAKVTTSGGPDVFIGPHGNALSVFNGYDGYYRLLGAIAVTQDGREAWRITFKCSTESGDYSTGCIFSSKHTMYCGSYRGSVYAVQAH